MRFSAVTAVALSLLLSAAPLAHAQTRQQQAQVLLERGNRQLQSAMQARGRIRTRRLEAALESYSACLELVRSRNVLFNMALTLQELERPREAFNLWSEYLAIGDLSADERAAGTERRDALRRSLAVLRVESEPLGAEVRVDRRDLPSLGRTPIEIAVEPGPHELILSREGYEERTLRVDASVGRTAAAMGRLEATPVMVQFVAPSAVTLSVDGEEVPVGRRVPITPGTHVLRVETPGVPAVERPFEVEPAAEPMTLTIEAPVAPEATVVLTADAEADVYMDGTPVGRGRRLSFPAAPGSRRLRLTAPGRPALWHTVSLDPGERLRLRATMPTVKNGAVVAGRWLLAGVSALGLAVATGFTVAADDQRDPVARARQAYEEMQFNDVLRQAYLEQRRELRDRLARADAAWALSAAIGLSTLAFFLFVDEGGSTPGSVRVAGGVGPDGGRARLEVAF